MPNAPYYAEGTNYNPGDWPQVVDQQEANEDAFTEGAGQQLSSAVQPTEATVAALGLSGDDRSWKQEVPALVVGAPSTVTPDLQGKQASKTPYVNLHLFP